MSLVLRHDAGNFLLTFRILLIALGIALSRWFALIVAMGISRFAFTSQAPLRIAGHPFSLTGSG